MHLVLIDGRGLPRHLVLLHAIRLLLYHGSGLLELTLDTLRVVHHVGDLLVLLLLLLLGQLNAITNLLLVVWLAGGRGVAEI